MILFIDLIGLNNEIANSLCVDEKIIFAHNFQKVKIKGDCDYINIKKLFESSYNPEYIIINRGSFNIKILNYNILISVSQKFPDSKIFVIMGEGDQFPIDVPINVCFKIICPSSIRLGDFVYQNLGIGLDIIYDNYTFEFIKELIKEMRTEKNMSVTTLSGKKRVLIVKKTLLAFSPDELVKAINKYSNKYEAKLNLNIEDGFDIIHYNNIYIPCIHDRKLIQYHSEPCRVMLPGTQINNSMGTLIPEKRLVLSQYQAGLKEYEGMIHVRNVINFESPLYNIKLRGLKEKLRISYSPSTTQKINEFFDKGYERTKEILESIDGIEFDIINGVGLQECIERKSNSDIVIDECITGSYHRSGLEGLALGKMTICWLNDKTKEILENTIRPYIIGTKEEISSNDEYFNSNDNRLIPFENVHIDALKEFLEKCVRTSREKIIEKGIMNRKWMEKFWNPKVIVNEYESIYDDMF